MLISFELRKILSGKPMLIVFAVIILQAVIAFIPKNYEHNYSPEVYKRYLTEYCGEYTQDTHIRLSARQAEIEEIIASHEEYAEKYHNDLISFEEYEEHNSAYNKASAEQSTVEYLLQKCGYYDEHGIRAELFYDTDWTDLFENMSFDYLIGLVILLIAVRVFCDEYSSGSRSVILTTPKGKRDTALSKLVIIVTFAFAVSALMYAVKLMPTMRESAEYATKPVNDLLSFPFDDSVTIIGYYLKDSIIKSLQWCDIAAFICLISVLLQNRTFVYFVSFVFTLCPAMTSDLIGYNRARYFFTSYSLGMNYSCGDNVALILTVSVFKLVLFGLLTGRVWCSSHAI